MTHALTISGASATVDVDDDTLRTATSRVLCSLVT